MNMIEIHNLGVVLGKNNILKELTLSVPEGGICALLGPNGAGKTTLIKTLMNIHTVSEGEAQVLGVPSKELSPRELQQIGYISENQQLPEYMKVKQFLDFCSSFYPNWDAAWCERMIRQMELPINQKLAELSRGMKIKTALLSSFSYHPKLLILDEPFSGLDPIVRDDFLDLIIELAGDSKATTFISSHDLHEVEQIADSVAFLCNGRIIVHQELDTLVTQFREVTVEFSDGNLATQLPPRWIRPRIKDNIIKFIDPNFCEEGIARELESFTGESRVQSAQNLTLKEIYRALVAR